MSMNLKFGKGEDCFSLENRVIMSDDNITSFDYLVFVDSRGLVSIDGEENSYLNLLKKYFTQRKISFLMISRPKHLTVFATLCNFLVLNSNLKFKRLITNIGFVDYTPKKTSNIDDIGLQIKQFSQIDNSIVEYESYKLNDGSIELLQSFNYLNDYIDYLYENLSMYFSSIFCLNTPIVSEEIKIDRERPASFFTQLKRTNELIENLISKGEKIHLIDISDYNFTYDAVHYTKDGHEKIFEKILKEI